MKKIVYLTANPREIRVNERRVSLIKVVLSETRVDGVRKGARMWGIDGAGVTYRSEEEDGRTVWRKAFPHEIAPSVLTAPPSGIYQQYEQRVAAGRSGGFTLTELLAVGAAIAVLGGGGYVVFHFIAKFW